ncbi:MAG TPA: GNAT family N-acetyltransferase [Candidatus Merdivicinus intestinigallinarum]|nr:GNAT family N-acetyltransferase [Candidatus Merdivicinus intestinigallinarum]
MWWNRFAYIDRLDVAPAYRRKGVATMLLQKAREWAEDQGARGIFLETQDINVPAMRLYEKNGFVLSGIDTMLYYNSPHRGETAVFYYLLFESGI